MTAPAESTAPAGPVISKTEVTWRGERLFDAGPTGRQHRIDAGAKEAPGPVETLLGAVATCSAVDIIDILSKRKTPVERLSVSVVGERRSEFPRRIMKLHIEYTIDGAGIEREHAERAMQLSFEKYCSVAASLAPDIVVDASLTLNSETGKAITQKIWTPSDK
ncbi:MAG TPA: OsmC family protein [Gemmatimonadaceae bacterium]|jgi:putative redox protein